KGCSSLARACGLGGGTSSKMGRNRGDKSLRLSFNSLTVLQLRSHGKRLLKSNWLSLASSDKNRSKMDSNVSLGWASERSILLITTMGLRPSFRALASTNLVWGITLS